MIICGDCLEVMRGMDAMSVDAIVTDPPYGLEFMGKEWDKLELRDAHGNSLRSSEDAFSSPLGKQRNGGDPFIGKGIRFAAGTSMQDWHYAWASAALRVAKPGAILMAFGGTRTFHRLACAIEDAGWEIRDCLGYMYGSGFPKSLSCTKATLDLFLTVSSQDGFRSLGKSEDLGDDYQGSCRLCGGQLQTGAIVVRDGPREQGDVQGYSHPSLPSVKIQADNGHTHKVSFGALSFHRATPDCQPLSSWLTTLLSAMESTPILIDDISAFDIQDDSIPAEDALRAWRSSTGGSNSVSRHASSSIGVSETNNHNLSKQPVPTASVSYRYHIKFCPACQDHIAKSMDHAIGFGTALKPAWEPIIMARKPLDGTVAANVQKWGTGAINVDGCRVGVRSENESGWSKSGSKASENMAMSGANYTRQPKDEIGKGRWPANLLHDGSEEVLELFPQTPGQLRAVGPEFGKKSSVNTFGDYGPRQQFEPRGDSGSSARFFYCAKASRKEREMGCEGMPVHIQKLPGKSTGFTPSTGEITNGYTGECRNHHPTVKPLALMRYLCRLITPPNGLVLDPFCGSGSTGIAALQEGFRFIGIDNNAEYVEIAKRRIYGTLGAGAES